MRRHWRDQMVCERSDDLWARDAQHLILSTIPSKVEEREPSYVTSPRSIDAPVRWVT